MTQLRIPAVYMRGGTSKGVFLRPEDLPADPAARDRMLLRIIGSSDRRVLTLDGTDEQIRLAIHHEVCPHLVLLDVYTALP